MSELIEQVRDIVRKHGRFSHELDSLVDLADDTDLYAAGMTSHASVGVMLALEAAFEVEFPDRLLTRSVFQSVSTLAAAIDELRGNQP